MGAETGAWTWVVVLSSCLTVTSAVVWAAHRWSQAEGRHSSAALPAALGVGAWLATAAVLGGLDVFRARDVGFPLIAPGIAVPIIVGIVALRRSPTLRSLIAATPPAGLVALHTLRGLGAVFLILMASGRLPAVFAYTAGVGDIVVAAAAPFVAWALTARKPWSTDAAVAFNVVGLADFVGAVGTGFFSAPSPIRLLFTTPSTELMTMLPMVLVPVFLVPAFAVLHVFSLWQLRERATARAGTALHQGVPAGAAR